MNLIAKLILAWMKKHSDHGVMIYNSFYEWQTDELRKKREKLAPLFDALAKMKDSDPSSYKTLVNEAGLEEKPPAN